tara:strand:+ start:458 stop:688 length:231 start_codon:yes stop_codon:yes gene_type:complete
MQLQRLGYNQTQITLADGHQVFFSYETPVAARTPDYKYYRTDRKWSVTTSRHINKWLEGVKATTMPQQFFDTLASN